MATIAERRKRYAEAARLYEFSAGHAVLAEYARFRAAATASKAGDAARVARLVGTITRESRFAEPAARLLGQALLSLGRPHEAAAAFAEAGDHATVLFALAQAAEAAGDLAGAAHALRRLTRRDRRTARRARAALEALRKRLPKKARAALDNPVDAMTRAREHLAAHRNRAAEEAVQDLLASGALPPGEAAWCAAWWVTARARTKARKHGAAALAYEELLASCPDDARGAEARLSAGRALYRADEGERALPHLERLWQDFPAHRLADDALYIAARVELDLGRAESAEELLGQLLVRYPRSDSAPNALWMLGEEAFPEDPLADPVAGRDRYTRGRLAYFRARALETEDLAEALRQHLAVARSAPMSYYALLALNRVRAKLPAEQFEAQLEALVAQPAAPARVEPVGVERDPDFQQGLALLRLGLVAQSWSAFAAARRRLHLRTTFTGSMIGLYEAAGEAAIATRILERELTYLDGVWPTGTYADRYPVVYPLAYAAPVRRWAERRAVPPALVFAVAREESRFDPGAESWANACGLMQLLPGTAQRIARADGLRSRITCARLLRPGLNLRLGTGLLAELDQRYEGHLGLMIAAYSAGTGSVRRWRREYGELPFDRWVEALPFVQTRRYIKHVLPALWVYQWQLAEPDAPFSARIPEISLTRPTGG